MDVLFQAIGSANLVWRSALHQVSWHHSVMALAYFGAAWLCVLQAGALKATRQPHTAWHFAGLVLCLLGTNTLLRTDLWVTDLMRSMAKLQGWYGVRRGLQYAVVLVVALATPVAARLLHRAFARGNAAHLAAPLGLAMLLLVLALRVVSAHGTDALLNWHPGTISVARLLELTGIALVVYGVLPRLYLGQFTLLRRFFCGADLASGLRTTTEDAPMIIVSATFVAEPLASPLAFMLAELGMEQTIHFSPYHQVFQELLTPASALGRNRSGTNIVLVRLEDFVREVPVVQSACQTVGRVAEELGAALDRFAPGLQGKLLLVVLPPSPAVPAALVRAIEAANAGLVESLALHDNIQAIAHADMDSIAWAQGYDARRDALAHIPLSDACFASLALVLSRRLHALRASPAKVLVLDCDNTLWRGVVGEDGVEGIALTPAYRALQAFAVAQQRKGVLLCLASKNAEADVLDVFARRSDMCLQLADVVAHRINWLGKSANLRSLADELNLGLDAFVFMDDNPLECAQMRAELPQVITLQVPQEAEIIGWLERIWAFDKLTITEEDTKRTQMYRENAARRSLESSVGGIAEFLEALDLQVDIQSPQEDEWQRVEQLTQRTNQFNFTTRRRTESELRALCEQGAQVLRVRVRDRFGDYGLVGVLIAQPQGDTLVADTFLLSCRVLGRGVEHAMLRALGERAQSLGVPTVVLNLVSSPRNEPARAFVHSVAADCGEATGDGFRYCVPVAKIQAVHHCPGQDADAAVQAHLAGEGKNTPPKPTGDTESRSQRYNRLASVLVSGEALLHALQLRHRRPRTLDTPALPPSSLTEVRLKQVWEDILCTDGLGVQDDWFALGGTSLQSVKLFGEIERLFGVQLRLTTILAAPTVRTLASVLEPGAADQSGIVPLRTGRRENLFLVHDGLGETLLYLHLARRLPDHLSVYGIEPRRLPGMPLAHSCMEDMAAFYVQQIQSIQPNGPYRLGGMCAGGVIAYAMAALLRSRGQQVELVTIMDGATPQAAERSGRVAAKRLSNIRSLLQGQGKTAPGAAGNAVIGLARVVLQKLANTVRYECGNWLLRQSVALRFRVLQTLLRHNKPWPAWLPALSVAQTYAELARRYVPPALPDVPVLLVRASSGVDADTPYKEIYRDDDLGWRQVAGQLSLVNVAGGHASMLQESHVDSLASALRSRLSVQAQFHNRSMA